MKEASFNNIERLLATQCVHIQPFLPEGLTIKIH